MAEATWRPFGRTPRQRREELTLEHRGSLAAHENDIVALYVAAYRDKLDVPFHHVDRFRERIRAYSKALAFEFVLGRIAGEPVGLALGFALPRGARWWHGLTTPVDPDLLREDGSRTFGLCELMTHPDRRGNGVAHRLHDELLYNRPERRATLIVDVDNRTARRAYYRWGWRHIGKLRPFPDAPLCDALILDLAVR